MAIGQPLKYHSSEWKKAHGFTLVEAMMTVLIAGFVLAAMYLVCEMHRSSYRKLGCDIKVQQNLRGGLVLMEREIRIYSKNHPDQGSTL